MPATLLKTHSNIDIFLWIFAQFLRTPILKNACERMLQNSRFYDITNTFQKTEAAVWSSPVKLIFLKISRNSNKSNCVGVSIWRTATRRRVINERLRHRYFPVSFTKFFRTPILKNFCEWLLTNLFYKSKPPAPKR